MSGTDKPAIVFVQQATKVGELPLQRLVLANISRLIGIEKGLCFGNCCGHFNWCVSTVQNIEICGNILVG
jgi:hypothetical protein